MLQVDHVLSSKFLTEALPFVDRVAIFVPTTKCNTFRSGSYWSIGLAVHSPPALGLPAESLALHSLAMLCLCPPEFCLEPDFGLGNIERFATEAERRDWLLRVRAAWFNLCTAFDVQRPDFDALTFGLADEIAASNTRQLGSDIMALTSRLDLAPSHLLMAIELKRTVLRNSLNAYKPKPHEQRSRSTIEVLAQIKSLAEDGFLAELKTIQASTERLITELESRK